MRKIFITSSLIAGILLSGCFQEEKKPAVKQTPVVQERAPEPVVGPIQEEIVPEVEAPVIEPPQYPPLPIAEDLVPILEQETIDLVDIKKRTVNAKLLELSKDVDIYLLKFIRTSNNKEYTLDLRKLSKESQQVVHAWKKYGAYLEEKKEILAEWEARVAEAQNNGQEMSSTANRIFDSLRQINN